MDQNSIRIAALILLLGSGVSAAILFAAHRRKYDPVAKLLHYVACFGVALLILPALAWCIGLSTPLNDPDQPIIVGIGGGAYGLATKYYPQVAGWFSICGVMLSVTAFFCFARSGMRLWARGEWVRLLTAHSKAISAAVFIIAGFAVAKLCLFFYSVGWERFWRSSIDRFEGDFALAAFGIDGRIFSLLTMIVGILLVFGSIFSENRVVPIVGNIANLVPVFAYNSRAFTVLAWLWLLLWAFRERAWTWRATVALPLCILAYLAPLAGRGAETTGVAAVAESVWDLRKLPVRELKIEIIRTLLNLGQGFPVMVEAVEAVAQGQSVLADTPKGYMLLSFSPVPSLVDRFAEDMLPFHPRVNVYTPVSALAECYSVSPLLMVVLFPSLWFLAAGACWGFSRRVPLVSVVAAAGCAATFLYCTQYNTRGATRYVIYAAEMTAVAGLAALILNVNPAQIRGQGALRRPGSPKGPVHSRER